MDKRRFTVVSTGALGWRELLQRWGPARLFPREQLQTLFSREPSSTRISPLGRPRNWVHLRLCFRALFKYHFLSLTLFKIFVLFYFDCSSHLTLLVPCASAAVRHARLVEAPAPRSGHSSGLSPAPSRRQLRAGARRPRPPRGPALLTAGPRPRSALSQGPGAAPITHQLNVKLAFVGWWGLGKGGKKFPSGSGIIRENVKLVMNVWHCQKNIGWSNRGVCPGGFV